MKMLTCVAVHSLHGFMLRRMPLHEGMIFCYLAPHTDAIPTLPLLLCFPGRNRTINVAQEIGVQYQLVGTALLDDTRGTILPGIRAACLAVTDDINIEVLRRWVQGREEGNCSWRSLIGVLRSSSCEALADDIEEAGSAPDTGSSLPVSCCALTFALYIFFILHALTWL